MRTGAASALFVIVAGMLLSVQAADAATTVVPVRVPLTGTRDTQVEAAVLRSLGRLPEAGGERGTLVLRFETAAGESAGGSEFGRAVELARFLADPRLAGVKTIAWLPEGATGHAVLVALACDEIAMPADAVIGPANTADATVDDSLRAAYRTIAARRRTMPPAIAEALVDPATRVLRVSTDDGEHFIANDDLDRLRQRVAVVEVEAMGPVPLAFTGRRGRELGFVQHVADSPAELAQRLNVSVGDLEGDPSLEGGWRPAVVSLSGGIGPESAGRLRSRIERAIADGSNFIWLRIDSGGGSPEQSLVLATWIASLDHARVRTVAYVPTAAQGDATLVALACDEVVMHPGAVLGGEGAAAIDGRRGEAVVAAWRGGVAAVRGTSWSLPAALVAPGIVVHRAEEQGTGRVDYFCEQELASRADRDSWKLGAVVGTGPFAVDGRRAEELGLAAHVVADDAGFREDYGLDGSLTVSEPGWSEQLLEALASPSLAWLLLLIGGAGLYIELKTPGVGFGGFVSMVAFIIYFWSQYLHGTSGWLEVMLFLAGAICVAAEIFVLPGFGILGLGGGLLVVASLILASQSFVLPVNDYQIRQMQRSLLGLLGAAVGVTVLGAVLRRWLPSTPFLRHVLLEPPDAAFQVTARADLMGTTGVTTTRLAPAGKARIDGIVRDVVSEASLIEPGEPVVVVAVRGGRVIVRSRGGA